MSEIQDVIIIDKEVWDKLPRLISKELMKMFKSPWGYDLLAKDTKEKIDLSKEHDKLAFDGFFIVMLQDLFSKLKRGEIGGD